MATTSPAVPAKLESDLAPANTASARWVDPSGRERSLNEIRLMYVPYLVGNEGDGDFCVPLRDVKSIDVDRERSFCVGPFPEEPAAETLVVAHWRRAPWGELIRLRPE